MAKNRVRTVRNRNLVVNCQGDSVVVAAPRQYCAIVEETWIGVVRNIKGPTSPTEAHPRTRACGIPDQIRNRMGRARQIQPADRDCAVGLGWVISNAALINKNVLVCRTCRTGEAAR